MLGERKNEGEFYFLKLGLWLGLFSLFFRVVVDAVRSNWFDAPFQENFGFINFLERFALYIVVPIFASYIIWKSAKGTRRDFVVKS
jgi:hypothetical protein